jgi:hypothetical protein
LHMVTYIGVCLFNIIAIGFIQVAHIQSCTIHQQTSLLNTLIEVQGLLWH